MIGLDYEGNLNYGELEKVAKEYSNYKGLKIGTFTACSNITGLITDTNYISFILHTFGFLAFFDFAAGAPYIPINMHGATSQKVDPKK